MRITRKLRLTFATVAALTLSGSLAVPASSAVPSSVEGVAGESVAAGPTGPLATVLSGTAGAWTYAFTVGEGTDDYSGAKAVCSDLDVRHAADTDHQPEAPVCNEGMFGPKKKEVKFANSVSANFDTSSFQGTVYLTRPAVERLRLPLKGGGKVTLKAAAHSGVVSPYGKRVRAWMWAEETPEIKITKKVLGQVKTCQRVKGKRRCGWKTVAKE